MWSKFTESLRPILNKDIEFEEIVLPRGEGMHDIAFLITREDIEYFITHSQ